MCEQCDDLTRRVEALESHMGAKPLPIEPDFLYTAKEVADRLRTSDENVYRLMQAGKIATTKTGFGKGFGS